MGETDVSPVRRCDSYTGVIAPTMARATRELELQFETKLYFTLSVWSGGLSNRRTSRDIHESSTAASSTRPEVRETEIRMVEDIEELRSELEFKSFTDLKILVNGEIKINQVWTSQDRAFCVAEHVSGRLSGSESGNCERSLVEPAVQSLMTRIAATERRLSCYIEREVFRITNSVRACARRASIGDVAAEQCVESLSAVHGGNAAYLPTAESGLRHFAGGGTKMFSLAERQIIDVTHGQTMAKIGSVGSLFCGNVV